MGSPYKTLCPRHVGEVGGTDGGDPYMAEDFGEESGRFFSGITPRGTCPKGNVTEHELFALSPTQTIFPIIILQKRK